MTQYTYRVDPLDDPRFNVNFQSTVLVDGKPATYIPDATKDGAIRGAEKWIAIQKQYRDR